MLPQLQRLGACTALWPSAFQPCSSTHPACSLFACQAEVEQYYIKAGYLFPAFHEFYWFGFQTTSRTWPTFRWLDPTVSRKDRCASAQCAQQRGLLITPRGGAA